MEIDILNQVALFENKEFCWCDRNLKFGRLCRYMYHRFGDNVSGINVIRRHRIPYSAVKHNIIKNKIGLNFVKPTSDIAVCIGNECGLDHSNGKSVYMYAHMPT